MNDFRVVVVSWLGGGESVSEDTATRCLLSIELGPFRLTRNESSWSQSTAETVHVSAYPLALWFASNWWRLRHEFPKSPSQQDEDWRNAHELAGSGSGYLWPTISIVCDGEVLRIRARSTPLTVTQPIRYIETCDETASLRSLEVLIPEFVELVLARLHSRGLIKTELELIWREVAQERRNKNSIVQRTLEAALGYDPDESPAEAMHKCEQLARVGGTNAVAELLADVGIDAVDRLSQLLRRDGLDTRALLARWPRDERMTFLARAQDSAVSTTEEPWRRGLETARALRRSMGMNGEALGSMALEQLLHLQPGTLDTHSAPIELRAGLAIESEDELFLLIRSQVTRNRRFEACRILADLITAPRADSWHPVTTLRTARQQLQRAFAAELLCPIEGLRRFFDGATPDDASSEAAAYFEVSEWVVVHQVENHLGQQYRVDAERGDGDPGLARRTI